MYTTKKLNKIKNNNVCLLILDRGILPPKPLESAPEI